MDTDELARACENENNAYLLDLTFEKVEQDKNMVLDELSLDEEDREMLLEKLKDYRYVDEIHDIKNGAYMRWINVSDPENISVSNGGFFCEVVFTDYETSLRMRNFKKRYFEIKLNDVILFQKLSSQEKVLLSALSYVSK
tara:strand:+ start:12112 stop:12531 length:420 start_codon:yes stop_codon:yes gene_type:complete